MPVAVADASALAAVAFGEAEGPAVAARLAPATLVAPALVWFEMASVCLAKIRRQPREADRLLRALGKALRVPIEIHEVDHLAVVSLARDAGLSAYDASYLWLSRRLGAELVTLDRALDAASRRP